MQIHKLTVMVVDHDDLGADSVKLTLEQQKYPNHCIYPEVMEIETREVVWSDDHPLNQRDTSHETFKRLFDTSEPTSLELAKCYNYSTFWSAEDGEWVAKVAEFPSLSHLDASPGAAVEELVELVAGVIEDLQFDHKPLPTPNKR